MAGTKMPRASWDIIETTDFSLPPLAEQARIVEILSDADTAINIAETSLITALKKQKRGLMQQLLTGKLRVPEKGTKK